MSDTSVCIECGAGISQIKKSHRAIYCSTSCKNRRWNREWLGSDNGKAYRARWNAKWRRSEKGRAYRAEKARQRRKTPRGIQLRSAENARTYRKRLLTHERVRRPDGRRVWVRLP
jgi:hypothetical protein